MACNNNLVLLLFNITNTILVYFLQLLAISMQYK